MEHRAAELERQVFDVPATAARPGRRRRRDMDRQQALSRLVPVGSAGSAGFPGPAPAESDSGQRVALATDAVIDAANKPQCARWAKTLPNARASRRRLSSGAAAVRRGALRS